MVLSEALEPVTKRKPSLNATTSIGCPRGPSHSIVRSCHPEVQNGSSGHAKMVGDSALRKNSLQIDSKYLQHFSLRLWSPDRCTTASADRAGLLK